MCSEEHSFMTSEEGEWMSAEGASEERGERGAHAIYGLIIVTSALVADRHYAEDALTSLLVVWGAGVVLLLAHLYSASVAEAGAHGHLLSRTERQLLVTDNLPVLAAVVVPSALIAVAGVGLLDLTLAIDLSIASAVVALFALGTYQSRKGGASVRQGLAVGALGALVGLVVIVLEVMLAH
jgi:hypothetical protein